MLFTYQRLMSLSIPPTTRHQKILCYYINDSNQLQIARLADPDGTLNKVVFPGERLLFTAYPYSQLEIQTETKSTSILASQLNCSRLQVDFH